MVKNWLIFPQELIVIHEMIGIEKKMHNQQMWESQLFFDHNIAGAMVCRGKAAKCTSEKLDVIASY